MVSRAEESLKILFLTAEAEPFAKVGGLADYSGSLPYAIKSLGQGKGLPVDIRVALPFHHCISIGPLITKKVSDLAIPTREGLAKGSVHTLDNNQVPFYLLKRSGHADGYRNVYSLSPTGDARKYVFFSLACLELIKTQKWQPDVIHANDWHTALAVYRLSQLQGTDPFYKKTRSLLAIHNLPYMGEGAQETLSAFNIPPMRNTSLPRWSLHLPLVMGIASADHIVAVSPSYAQELQQEEFAHELKDFFTEKAPLTSGILNDLGSCSGCEYPIPVFSG
jgi:starch synthase